MTWWQSSPLSFELRPHLHLQYHCASTASSLHLSSELGAGQTEEAVTKAITFPPLLTEILALWGVFYLVTFPQEPGALILHFLPLRNFFAKSLVVSLVGAVHACSQAISYPYIHPQSAGTVWAQRRSAVATCKKYAWVAETPLDLRYTCVEIGSFSQRSQLGEDENMTHTDCTLAPLNLPTRLLCAII